MIGVRSCCVRSGRAASRGSFCEYAAVPDRDGGLRRSASSKSETQSFRPRCQADAGERPYSKGQKNDFRDAEAIAEAVQRPTMKFVATRKQVEDLSLVSVVGLEPSCVSRSFLGLVLLWLGFPEESLSIGEAAIAQAKQTKHTPTIAMTLTLLVRTMVLIGDHTRAQRHIGEQVALTSELSFPFWRGQALVYLGWLRGRPGDIHEAIAIVREGRSVFLGTGGRLSEMYMQLCLRIFCSLRGIWTGLASCSRTRFDQDIRAESNGLRLRSCGA